MDLPLDSASGDLVLCNLGSGSRGNATYVGRGGRGLLVDAGLTVRQIRLRLAARGIPEGAVQGILLTHEHGDHVHAARRLADRWGLPVYATAGTAAGAGIRDLPTLREIRAGEPFTAAGLTVEPVSIPHDTLDPVAYVVGDGRDRAAVATDIGEPTGLLVEKLAACALVMLEFNHDPVMLAEGPYPAFVKRRVRGPLGHLSNPQALEVLERLGPTLRRVLLAHLSQHNNRPALALSEARTRLLALGREDVALGVLGQYEASPVYRVADGEVHEPGRT